jgi:glycosyltransferase involved in cell wall biosynthesis
MKRILLATDCRFWEVNNGSSSRIHSLFSSLCAAGYEVGLFFVGTLSNDERLHLQNKGVACVCNVIDGRTLIHSSFSISTPSLFFHLPRYLLKLWYRFRSKSFPYERFYHRKTLDCFESFIDVFNPEVVIVEYLRFSFLSSEKNRSNLLWILDSHDVMYLRFESYLRRGLLHWISINKEQEAEALSKFDAVIAIQHEEADIFRQMVNVPVLTVSHAVNASPVSQCAGNRMSVGFIAGDSHVNYEGILWFIANVWPSIREQLPTAKLYLGGSICRRLKNMPDDNIENIGYVEHLSDFYSSVDIAINPVFSGGGLKIKNVESLAFGVPLITTLVGAQGMIFDEKPSFLIAESSHDFAEVIIKLLMDEALRASYRTRGLSCVENYFSHESVYRSLLEFIDKTDQD